MEKKNTSEVTFIPHFDMRQYGLSRMTTEQIERLSDEEIWSLSMPRPGYPKQRGFLLNPRLFPDRKNLATTMHALMTRLSKVKRA